MCSAENPPDATHCTNCRVNLKLALKDPKEVERVRRKPVLLQEPKTVREKAATAAKVCLAVLAVAGLGTCGALVVWGDLNTSQVGRDLSYLFSGLWALCAVWVFLELDRALGRRGLGWMTSIELSLALVVLIAPLLLIVLAFYPDAEECPYCERPLPQRALTCPHCDADLTVQSVPGQPDPSRF
jgi:hypothetical protein